MRTLWGHASPTEKLYPRRGEINPLRKGTGNRMEPERAQPEGDGPEAESRLVRLSLLFYGAMMAAALIWRVGFYGEPIFFFSEEAAAAGLSPLRDGAIGLGVGLLTVALSRLWTEYSAAGDRMGRAMAEALGPLSGPHAVLLALASGLGEELFFRGALQPRVGWAAASLLFGAVHFVPRRDMLPCMLERVLLDLLARRLCASC